MFKLFVLFFLPLLILTLPVYLQAATTEKALFAGGCFWCMQPPFDQAKGVTAVIVGYTGGTSDQPTYETYASGGHLEAIEVTFDPSIITYDELLTIYWHQIDPTDDGGQFVDRGASYRSAIFYFSDGQKRLAENSKSRLAQSGHFAGPLVTQILPAQPFHPAEAYHQGYYQNNPLRYKFYRHGSGRDAYLGKIWGASQATPASKREGVDLKSKLTPLQYDVTQKNGTEPAFQNDFWDNKREGIYVDIVSGEPLFSSQDKYDSGTGWPSFTRPLVPGNIVEKADNTLFSKRTEVRSKHANSHLGHVFPDGPKPTGLRYCLNSAALRFIPKSELEQAGLAEFTVTFTKKDSAHQDPLK